MTTKRQKSKSNQNFKRSVESLSDKYWRLSNEIQDLIAKTSEADGIEIGLAPKLTKEKISKIEKALFGKKDRKLPLDEVKRLQHIALQYYNANKLHHASAHELRTARLSLKLYVDYLADILQTSDELFQVLSEPQNSAFAVLDQQGLDYANEVSAETTHRLFALKQLSQNLHFKNHNDKGGNPSKEHGEAIRICIIKLKTIYKKANPKCAVTYTYDPIECHMKSPFFDFVWEFFKQIDNEISWEYVFTIIRDIVKNQN